LSITLREEHRLKVFVNRALRSIFGPNRKEVGGGWRRLHNEELHILYSSRNIIRVINSRRMRWVRGMYHAWERLEMHIKFLFENLNGRDHLEFFGVDGK
jgi:hypothetical protein